MKRDVLRSRICWALAGSHLFAIFFSAAAIGTRFGFEDALNVIMIVTPLTGAYLTTMVQYFVTEQASAPDEVLVSKTAATLFMLLTAAFCAALLGVMIITYQGLMSPPLLTRSVAGIEAVLGVYVSLFVKVLFDAGAPGAQTAGTPAG